MKYIILFLSLITCVACVQKNPAADNQSAGTNKDSLIAALMNTDKSWSESSLKDGYFHSRDKFLTDNSIELSQDSMPLSGKKAIVDYDASHSDSAFTLQWKPLRADVAASGDMGYTYGSWTMKKKTKAGVDTTLCGVYWTVWQKQADGSWKYVVDGGNDTPHPVE